MPPSIHQSARLLIGTSIGLSVRIALLIRRQGTDMRDNRLREKVGLQGMSITVRFLLLSGLLEQGSTLRYFG